MIGKRMLLCVVVVLGMTLGIPGCGKSDSTGSGTSSGGGQTSALDREAQDAVMAEIQRRWVKGADGWITARVSGSAYAPDHYLRQIRQITVHGAGSDDLGESDRLNGVEWNGQVSFEKSPAREAGDPGMLFEGMAGSGQRPRGQWSQWVDMEIEPVRLQKVKGKWQIQTDTWLLRGSLPTAEDFAKAGVK